MRKCVESQITFQAWERRDPRYMRLNILDRWLDKTIYKHLMYSFQQENDAAGVYIRVDRREPSSKWHLPWMLAAMSARKLFAGRHAPVLVHPDKKIREKLQKLSQEAKLPQRMIQAATWGAVGSAAITFRIARDEERPRVVLSLWRARHCIPSFDELGELENLRVRYPVDGAWWQQQGFNTDVEGKPITAKGKYWFVRDFGKQREVTYQPVLLTVWKPENPDRAKLQEIPEGPMGPHEHGFGFVPGHWFLNLVGGEGPDGACTFEPALDNVCEIDYTMSMIGLGIRYSATPQLVLQGDPEGIEGSCGGVVYRGPTRAIKFAAAQANRDTGQTTGGGDAHLLEPTGQGMQVGIKDYIRQLKKDALEQVAGPRKDPDKVTTAMSGRAIENVEEEFTDLIQELRINWGEYGQLPLQKKIALAAAKEGHPLAEGITREVLEDLSLGWPAIHDIEPGDYLSLVQGIDIAIKGGISGVRQGRDFYRAQVDVPTLDPNEEDNFIDPMVAAANSAPASPVKS